MTCMSGNYELVIGITASVNFCLSLCVSPVRDWQPIQGIRHFLLQDSRDRLQAPHLLELDNQKKWMDDMDNIQYLVIS